MENEFYQKYKKYKQKYLDLVALDNSGIYYGGAEAKKGNKKKKKKTTKSKKSKKATPVCPQHRGKQQDCLAHPPFTQEGIEYRCSYRRPDVCYRIKSASAEKSHERVRRGHKKVKTTQTASKPDKPAIPAKPAKSAKTAKQTQHSGTIIKGFAQFHDIANEVSPGYDGTGYITAEMNEGLDERIINVIREDENIRDGDVLFVGSTHETRQAHGFGLVKNGRFTGDVDENVEGNGYDGIINIAAKEDTLDYYDYNFALLEIREETPWIDKPGDKPFPPDIVMLSRIVTKIRSDLNTLRGSYRTGSGITKKQRNEAYQTFIENVSLVWSSLDSYLMIKKTAKTRPILESWEHLKTNLSDFLNTTKAKKNRTEDALDKIPYCGFVFIPAIGDILKEEEE